MLLELQPLERIWLARLNQERYLRKGEGGCGNFKTTAVSGEGVVLRWLV